MVPVKQIPDFRGQVMAVDRVERLLRKVTRALDKAGVAYAVIGGNAVAAWVASVDAGAVRATKDLDLLVRRRDMASISEALRAVDLMPVEVLGVWMFVDRRRPSPKTGVHLIFAGELIRPYDKIPAPTLEGATRLGKGFHVLDLPGLLQMKLTAFRDVDRVHIRDLLSVGLIDEDVVRRLPSVLRKRLDEIREASP
jgi:hypothetical protein